MCRVELSAEEFKNFREEPCPFCGESVDLVGFSFFSDVALCERIEVVHDCAGMNEAHEIFPDWVRWWLVKGHEVVVGHGKEREVIRAPRCDDPLEEFRKRISDAEEVVEVRKRLYERAKKIYGASE